MKFLKEPRELSSRVRLGFCVKKAEFGPILWNLCESGISRKPLARCMAEIHDKVTIEGATFAQQYLLNRGLKAFGEAGKAATSKEMDQLHRRNCFAPMDIAELTPSEKKKAMEASMFLTEKRDKTIKGRMVCNGNNWLCY